MTDDSHKLRDERTWQKKLADHELRLVQMRIEQRAERRRLKAIRGYER